MEPTGKQRSRIDSEFLKFFLFDALLATIVGFVSWIVTRDQVSSLVISLVTGAILLLVELRFQLAKTKDDLVESMGFQRSTLEDPQLREAMRRAVAGYTGTVARGDSRFTHRARSLLADVANDLNHLHEGFLEIPHNEMYDHAISLMKETKASVMAHSLVEGNDFWFRGAGKNYVEENLEAARRGVRITRVFTVDSVADLQPATCDLIRLQLDAGMDARICFTKSLDRNLLVDFVLFDDRYVMYWDLVPGSKEMRGGRLFSNESELRRVRAIFSRVVKESEPAGPILAQIGPPVVKVHALRPEP